MKDEDYLHNKKYYLKHVFSIWQPYFENREDFEQFYEAIPSDKEKGLFLRIGSFYKYLIKVGHYKLGNEFLNKGMSYIDDSYKFITLFSFMEALYSEEEHLDFYQYLMRRKRDIRFQLDKKPSAILDEAYKSYKTEFGSQRCALKFFQALDLKDKDQIAKKLKVNGSKKALNELVQILYQIRSEFVHRALFVLGFGKKPSVGKVGKKVVSKLLSMKDMQNIFERGFLKRFELRNQKDKP